MLPLKKTKREEKEEDEEKRHGVHIVVRCFLSSLISKPLRPPLMLFKNKKKYWLKSHYYCIAFATEVHCELKKYIE